MCNTAQTVFLYSLYNFEQVRSISVSAPAALSIAVFSRVQPELILVQHGKRGGLFIENRNFRTGRVARRTGVVAGSMASAHCWAGEKLVMGTCEGEVLIYDCEAARARRVGAGHDEMIIKGVVALPLSGQ